MGTTPSKGRADHLVLGDWNAICPVCGQKFKASEMVRQPDGIGPPWAGGQMVCKRDYRPRQPQDFVRGIPERMAAPWVQRPVDLFVQGDYLITEQSSDEDPNYINTEDFYPITTEN